MSDFFQGLISKANSYEVELEKYNTTGRLLESLLSEYHGNSKGIMRRVFQITGEYRKVCSRLSDHLALALNVHDQALEFVEILDYFNTWVDTTKKGLSEKQPSTVSRDIANLKATIEQYEVRNEEKHIFTSLLIVGRKSPT